MQARHARRRLREIRLSAIHGWDPGGEADGAQGSGVVRMLILIARRRRGLLVRRRVGGRSGSGARHDTTAAVAGGR